MTTDGPTQGGYPEASGNGDPTEWDPFAGDATAGDTGTVGAPGAEAGGYDEQPTVIAGPDPYAQPQGYPAQQYPGDATSTQTYAGAPGGPDEPTSKRGLVIAIVVLAVILALVAVILAFTLGRGGSSTTTTVAPPPTPSASPSPSPSVSPSPSPSPSVSPSPSPSPSPTRTGAASPADAAQGLYAARIDNNRNRAKQFATQTAIDQIWGSSVSGYSYMGCDREGSRYICSYYAEGSAMSMRVEGSDASGWKVTTVNFIAD